MPPDENDDCEFAGWTLLDLDDPTLKRALEASQRLGMPIEQFIEMALQEKLERIGKAFLNRKGQLVVIYQ
jgi:hypothetical protein